MFECAVVLLLAFLLDLIMGDPNYFFHPVRLMGKLILGVERFFLMLGLFGYASGILLVLVCLAAVISVSLGLGRISLAPMFIVQLYLVYSVFALKDLNKHGLEVLDALLAEDLLRAREKVQKIVARDANQLEREGIIRASVESLSESFVDSFFAPLFWYTSGAFIAFWLGFLPINGALMAILSYRMINTLDSMVGYKNEQYQKFGYLSAKLDDGLNWVPARISILILSLSAWILRLDYQRAWKIGWQDRLKHHSPNAGHPESSVAGALGIRLGGPSLYFHGWVEKPWMGEETQKIKPAHIQKTIQLIQVSALLAIMVFMACFFVTEWFYLDLK